MAGEFPHSEPHLAIPQASQNIPNASPNGFSSEPPTGWRSLPERSPHHKRDPLAERGRAPISRVLFVLRRSQSWRTDAINIQQKKIKCFLVHVKKHQHPENNKLHCPNTKSERRDEKVAGDWTLTIAAGPSSSKVWKGSLCSVARWFSMDCIGPRPLRLIHEKNSDNSHGSMGKWLKEQQGPWSLKGPWIVFLGKVRKLMVF